MRKTRPINLPEQLSEQPAHFLIEAIPESSFSRYPCHSSLTPSTSTTLFADETASFDGSTNDTLPLVEAIEPAPIATAPMSSPYAIRTARSYPPGDPLQSLGDEYLNVLTHQLTVDQLRHAAVETSNQLSNFHRLYSDDEYEGIDNSVTRPPRQLGRRAEGRARIVSITTETNSAGNQVIVSTHIIMHFTHLLIMMVKYFSYVTNSILL